MNRTRLALLSLLALVLIAALSALGYRAYRQHEYAQVLAISSAAGIDERLFVPINGIEHYVTIRGEDRSNPVMLILAGGPGNTLIPFAPVFREWERQFTIVQWDQRGTAKTLERNGEAAQGTLTIQQAVDDGLALTKYLRSRLGAAKIILLGHSWGTILGVGMIKSEPESFYAYVGTGQVVDKEEKEELIYEALMRKLEQAHDDGAIAQLKQVGPPPYKSQQDLLVERHISQRYDTPAERDLEWTLAPMLLFAPNYTLCDIYYALRYSDFASDRMYAEIKAYDARRLGAEYGVPIFIFNGDQDAITPESLAHAWFDALKVPHKEFATLSGGGHSALLTMSDTFLRELVVRVRPLAH